MSENKKELPKQPNFDTYRVSADSKKLRCVDERNGVEPFTSFGSQFPGAIGGIIDTIKVLTGKTEEQAWQFAIEKNVPIAGHIDDHHGDLGCGYEKLVQNEPATVLAREPVTAQSRVQQIQKVGGEIVTLTGEHHPTHAVINEKPHTTINPEKANHDSLGIFNYDKWAAREIAVQLELDPDQFADHLEEVYKKTVIGLKTGITEFTVIS